MNTKKYGEEEKAGQQLHYCSVSSNDYNKMIKIRSQQEIEVEGKMKVF